MTLPPLPDRNGIPSGNSKADRDARDSRNIRFFLIVCAIPVGLLIAGLATLRIVNDAQREFDSTAWKSSDPWNRGRMVDDVRVRFLGASRATVLDEFGDSVWENERDSGPITFLVDRTKFYEINGRSELLMIEFDASNRVSAIRLVDLDDYC